MSSDANPAPASSAPVPAAAPGTVGPIIIQQSGSLWWRVLAGVGWTGFLFCALTLAGMLATRFAYFDTTEGIRERFHSGSQTSADKIAIIEISGVIMEGESSFAKHQIDYVAKDDFVKALVVRINSPGGTVTGSDYILHHLRELKKKKDEQLGTNMPLIVSMGSIAASGGYYVAMAAGSQRKAIYAEPTTTTGSIGVIIPHYDLSDLMEKYNIKDDSIVSHPRKQMLSMTRKLPDDEREILQSYVNESFGRFKEIIQAGRPQLAAEKLATLATGEIFTAEQAKKHGLVDEIGFVEDALQRAADLAELDLAKVRVVRYEAPPTLLGLGGLAQQRGPDAQLQLLLALSAPRAWFLSTSLPALISTTRGQ